MFSTGALLGIATYLCLVITFSLGIAIHHFYKPWIKIHRTFAYITLAIATIHALYIFISYY